MNILPDPTQPENRFENLPPVDTPNPVRRGMVGVLAGFAGISMAAGVSFAASSALAGEPQRMPIGPVKPANPEGGAAPKKDYRIVTADGTPFTGLIRLPNLDSGESEPAIAFYGKAGTKVPIEFEYAKFAGPTLVVESLFPFTLGDGQKPEKIMSFYTIAIEQSKVPIIQIVPSTNEQAFVFRTQIRKVWRGD